MTSSKLGHTFFFLAHPHGHFTLRVQDDEADVPIYRIMLSIAKHLEYSRSLALLRDDDAQKTVFDTEFKEHIFS
ncbi:MAG: hypothetical protein NT027_14090 [Proteobacteria bacterium]|nr:hypothetical protein [Pseudomonadota bacterium]